jgi:hypothetical protein
MWSLNGTSPGVDPTTTSGARATTNPASDQTTTTNKSVNDTDSSSRRRLCKLFGGPKNTDTGYVLRVLVAAC